MDSLDVSILRWFFQGHQTAPFRPEVKPMIKALSKQLGVTGETVRNRMRRMFESGVLKGIVLQPNPAVLGSSIGALGFFVQNGTPRGALAKKLSLVDGAQLVVTHLDGMIGVVFMHDGGESLDRKVKLIMEMGGVSDAFFTELPFPPCQLELSRTDWRIMAVLRPDATKSYKELSKTLGLSSRTIKRRLDRMVAGNAVFSIASHQVRAVESGVEANMVVFYDPSVSRPETDARIIKEIRDYLLYAGLWARYSVYAVALPNVASSDAVAERVRRIRGVKDARSAIIEERLELYQSLDGMIAKKVAEADRRGEAPVSKTHLRRRR